MPTNRCLSLLTLASLLLAHPAATLAQVAAPLPTPLPRAIHVTGEAKVSVPPDVARVLLGVVTVGKDLGKVTRDGTEAQRRLLAALKTLGIAEKDVVTVRHDLQIERPYDKGKPGPISGYTVSDQVQVTVRDLAKLGAVLDQATRAGANGIDALTLERDDATPERARALALAYAAARTKAEALAKAAGVGLGEVLAVEESSGQRGPVPLFKGRAMAFAERASGDVPVAQGELEITGQVDVTFGIR